MSVPSDECVIKTCTHRIADTYGHHSRKQETFSTLSQKLRSSIAKEKKKSCDETNQKSDLEARFTILSLRSLYTRYSPSRHFTVSVRYTRNPQITKLNDSHGSPIRCRDMKPCCGISHPMATPYKRYSYYHSTTVVTASHPLFASEQPNCKYQVLL
jgi:hypothetical protein